MEKTIVKNYTVTYKQIETIGMVQFKTLKFLGTEETDDGRMYERMEVATKVPKRYVRIALFGTPVELSRLTKNQTISVFAVVTKKTVVRKYEYTSPDQIRKTPKRHSKPQMEFYNLDLYLREEEFLPEAEIFVSKNGYPKKSEVQVIKNPPEQGGSIVIRKNNH